MITEFKRISSFIISPPWIRPRRMYVCMCVCVYVFLIYRFCVFDNKVINFFNNLSLSVIVFFLLRNKSCSDHRKVDPGNTTSINALWYYRVLFEGDWSFHFLESWSLVSLN